MSEIAVAAPAAAPAAPPPAAPAEVVTDQKPAESAPATAPDNEKPDQAPADQQEKRSGNRFERRINRLHRRAAEAEARAKLLEQQIAEMKPKAPASNGAPRLEDFEDVKKYAEAVERHARETERKTFETEQQTKAQREERERVVSGWEKKAQRGSDKYEDWDEIVGDIEPNSVLSLAIMEAENGEDIAHHLGTNRPELERIASLPPRAQIREIAKLEVKLSAEPPKPKSPSKAPAPISPITGTKAADATEVKDGMDYKDFLKVRNRQLGRSK